MTKGNSFPQDTASKFYLTEGGKSNNRGQCFKKICGNVTQDGRIIQGGKSYFTREIPVKVTEQRNRAILKGI